MEFIKDKWFLANDFVRNVEREITGIPNEIYFDKNKDRTQNSKLLLEEFLPLSHLAAFIQIKCDCVVEVIGFCNSRSDVDGKIKLINKDYEFEYHIEITCSGICYDSALREQLLLQDGMAPDFGVIERDENTNRINVKTIESKNLGEHTELVKSNIIEAFRKKTKKSYPEKTILLISFEHHKIGTDTQWALLLEKLKGHFITEQTAFSEIYLFNSWHKEIRRIL